MNPILAQFAHTIDQISRDYFNRYPMLANELLRSFVLIALGFYAGIPGATKERAKMFLDETFERFCRAHRPWNDSGASAIWTPDKG